MIGWVDDIEHTTLANETFRSVVHTGPHLQLTVMRLVPGEDIGVELHADRDQFIRVESGRARVELSSSQDHVEETHQIEADGAAIIPAGTWHNVVNAGEADLRLYSIYAPPEHPDGTVHPTKADSLAAHEHQPG